MNVILLKESKIIHTHDSSDLNTSSESNTCIVREVPIVMVPEKRKEPRTSIHIPIRLTSTEQNYNRVKAIEESSFDEFAGKDTSIAYIDAPTTD